MLKANKVYHMDCIDGFRKLDDNSVDLIVTDPPYYIPVLHYQTRKRFSRNFADLGILEHFFKDVFREFERILKPTGRIYLFCDGQSYPLFYYHLYLFCKRVRPLIWDKKTSINGYSWRHQHEIIIFVEMPKAKPVPSGDGDVIKCPAVRVNEREHPAEKPVELLKKLIEKSSEPGNLVLDPFAGGGSTLLACRELGRNYIGFERNLEYFKIAQGRLMSMSIPVVN